jgi:hypothetical protein
MVPEKVKSDSTTIFLDVLHENDELSIGKSIKKN